MTTLRTLVSRMLAVLLKRRRDVERRCFSRRPRPPATCRRGGPAASVRWWRCGTSDDLSIFENLFTRSRERANTGAGVSHARSQARTSVGLYARTRSSMESVGWLPFGLLEGFRPCPAIPGATPAHRQCARAWRIFLQQTHHRNRLVGSRTRARPREVRFVPQDEARLARRCSSSLRISARAVSQDMV